MKKYFSLFVIAGLILVGVVAFFLHSQAELNKKEFQRDLAVVKEKFGESIRPLTSSGDPAAYTHEMNELLKRYKGELDKLASRNREILDLDAEKHKFEEADAKKPPSPEQKKLRDEYFETTKGAFTKLMSGGYAPELTGFQNGARVDFIGMRRVTTPEGEEMLRADFIAWGFPKEVNWGDIHMAGWVTKAPDKDGKKPAKKPAAPVAGEEDGREIKYKFDASSARPIISINNAERWVPAFPPGATIGYYYLQLVPRDTERLDLGFTYQFTTEGGRIVPVEIAFKQMQPKDLWMLAPGAKFEAQEKEASDNERRGKSEDDPTASAKPTKKKR
jgi:hypothetical protein